MKSVVVLMSTYNGEKYLKEQIDSLLAQRDVNVQIYIRDDGSTDNTLNIIDSYHDNRVSYYCGKNIGPAKSFIELVCKAPKADYYAYCDQDDVWNDDKLAEAITRIGRSRRPALYMSTYEVVDKDLNLIKIRDMKFNRPYTLGRTVICDCPSGCTMVFNSVLKQILAANPPEYLRMHDYWTLLTVEALNGLIVCDETPRLKYRQHDNNTVGIVPSKMTRIKRLVHSVRKGDHERWRQACALLSSYGDIMPDESKKSILKIVNYRKSLKNKFEFAFSKEFIPVENNYKILFFGSVLLGVF